MMPTLRLKAYCCQQQDGSAILKFEELSTQSAIVSANQRPETIAYVRITQQSWQQGKLEGEVRTASYEWRFQWHFRRGKLTVQPSLGKALIFEPLGRFLERYDYQLEPGGDYQFTVRAKL